jgi:L-aspartate oxidase
MAPTTSGADPERRRLDADVLVVGTGIAGLTFALQVAPLGRVVVITKKNRADSNTNWARGGIAAGLGDDDDPQLHLRDTLAAGAGLSHVEVAERVVREGPERVRELVEWGVRFNTEGGRLSLGMEGGHSRRRIVRAGDRTGREVERALLEAVAAEPGIEVLEHLLAVDLSLEIEGAERRCTGIVALDVENGGRVELRAPITLLASGGSGQVYRYTTNPMVATGDGIAMAWRAGARVANLEFIQFHPTALYPAEDPAFLLTEAIRGEGGVLRRRDGTLLMRGTDERGSLATRDVVARAIHQDLLDTGEPNVILDVAAIPREVMERRFPGAVEGCLARGVDLFGTGIPVVPAAHYGCGGVVTDLDGRTSLAGLFASGEVACTGLHGANRLASNSLLEAVVFSHRAARLVLDGSGDLPWPEVETGEWPARAATEADAPSGAPGSGPVSGPLASGSVSGPAASGLDRALPSGALPDLAPAGLRERLRVLMWEGVGIVRSDEGLAASALEIAQLRQAIPTGRALRSESEVELANLVQVAELIVRCALLRRESRGLHYNRDHPLPDEAQRRDTVLDPLRDG